METLSDLSDWVTEFSPGGVPCGQSLTLAPLTGDAGFRQYFRTNLQPSSMAVFAPPEHENTPAFVAKDLALRAQGVHAPKIFAVDFKRGFLVQEDFGDTLLSSILSSETVGKLYTKAEKVLCHIQGIAAEDTVFPRYDQAMLYQEMALFPEWFVERLLGIELSDADRTLLDSVFEQLISSAQEQPQVVVHRDFHSRNLMLLPGGELGVIDFQDAVIGPFSYDLVSLLKDCYIRWPPEMVRQRALNWLTADIGQRGIAADEGQLLAWFDLMGLQRHIKVLGIFARLWLRDGKARYLNDLPLVLRYTVEVAAAYPQLDDFNQWLAERILPLLPQQPWCGSWQTAGE